MLYMIVEPKTKKRNQREKLRKIKKKHIVKTSADSAIQIPSSHGTSDVSRSDSRFPETEGNTNFQTNK